MPSRFCASLYRVCCASIAWGISTTAQAHSFGKIYNLPVPFWLYAYGATAALVLSFLITAYFAGSGVTRPQRRERDVSAAAVLRTLRRWQLKTVLQTLSLLLFVLCLATGFWGNRSPYANFNMTFFWIICVLALAYATALFGDAYAVLSPWRVLANALTRIWPRYGQGLVQYPAWLASWPALGFYLAFIWIELFAHINPFTLAVILSAYSVINLLGVGWVGRHSWFTYCEFFSVFFAHIARMAAVDYGPGRLRLRLPFAGLLRGHAANFSELLFILFMLSSTAFDGLRATLPWMKLFWQDPFHLLTPLLGKAPIFFYGQLRPWYDWLETASLMLSPLVYLAVYGLCMAVTKLITGSRLRVRELMLRFAYSLLPIALVYNITHYYTLLLTQGVKIVSLASDPFGWGWDLFGTAMLWRAPILPSMTLVWHSQVALILFGHIVSVVVAHVEALRCYPTRRLAMLSQLPMLLLMVTFTTAGLWILSQPLQLGQ